METATYAFIGLLTIVTMAWIALTIWIRSMGDFTHDS